MYRVFLAAILAATIFASSSVFAQQVMQPFVVADVVAQQEQIRLDVTDSDNARYRNMSARDRKEILSRQEGLLQMLQGHEYVDLSDKQRTEAFNMLEWISAAVNQDGDENMVCERVKTIGSNRIERVCKTVSQRQKEREDSQKMFQKGTLCGGGMRCGGG